MTQKTGILLVGLNGAGKSTFGKYAAKELGFDFMDIEDYWFEVKHDYQNPRSADEVSRLLLKDIKKSERGFIIGGNISSLSHDLLNFLSLIIYMDVKKEVRIARVIQRDQKIYGDLQPGDSLYQERQTFLNFVKGRTPLALLKWIDHSNVPSITINGENTFENNLKIIQFEMSSQEKKA